MLSTRLRYQTLAKTIPLSGLAKASDQIVLLEADPVLYVALIDAAAQGAAAVRSVEQAGLIVSRGVQHGIAEVFVEVHRALAGKPGVSLAIARIDFEDRRMAFSGVGRVYGILAGATDEPVLSEPGTVGIGLPKVPGARSYAFGPGDLLCLAADGIVDIWDIASLWRHRTATLPFLLARAAGSVNRMPDDASIVLVRAE